MCGINGFTFENRELVEKMNTLVAHRGPDGSGVWVGDGMSFGHTRLSIIDVADRASQPMWDEKHEVVIIFNGEIYNYRELRAELASTYAFRTTSDTEVILAAYRAQGIACVQRLNGIFAFALWDTRTRELFLARDAGGIKPLYYTRHGTQLIFSSEIKTLFVHAVPKRIHTDAVAAYISLLYVPGPYTMFEGVMKLPAGTYLRFHEGAMHMTAFDPPTEQCVRSFSSRAQAVAEIRRVFDASVEAQMVSDRPLGIFLSGGIDSTAIVGSVRSRHAGDIQTFSVGFLATGDEKKFNTDFELARATARHFKTQHHELRVSGEDIRRAVSDVAWHLDQPNANPTAASIFLLSRFAKQSVSVVLGGDGADELFGGYDRYFWSRLISLSQQFPEVLQKLFCGIVSLRNTGAADKFRLPPNEQRIMAFMMQHQHVVTRVVQHAYRDSGMAHIFFQDALKHVSKNHTDFERTFMEVDRATWLVDDSLARTDTMTMAFGVEERVPILDPRLVAIADAIPTRWKVPLTSFSRQGFQGKRIWIDAVRDYLPAHVIRERKRGWFTPVSKWMRTSLEPLVDDVLSPGRLNEEVFDGAVVRELWEAHRAARAYHFPVVWAVVMWQLWYEQFFQ